MTKVQIIGVVGNVRHEVGEPFMVIATQNPIEQAGTYRLPEAQLDRFLFKTSVGYPDAESTEELLLSSQVRDRAGLVTPVVSGDDIARMIATAGEEALSCSEKLRPLSKGIAIVRK